MEVLIGATIGIVFWTFVGLAAYRDSETYRLRKARRKTDGITVAKSKQSNIAGYIVRRYNALPARYRNEDIESILTELDAQYGTTIVSKHYAEDYYTKFVYCDCEYSDGGTNTYRHDGRSTEFCERYSAIRDQVEKLHKIAAEQERIMREQSITTATADDLITRLKQEVEVGRAVTEEMQGQTHKMSLILPPANYTDTVKVLADGLVLRRKL